METNRDYQTYVQDTANRLADAITQESSQAALVDAFLLAKAQKLRSEKLEELKAAKKLPVGIEEAESQLRVIECVVAMRIMQIEDKRASDQHYNETSARVDGIFNARKGDYTYQHDVLSHVAKLLDK